MILRTLGHFLIHLIMKALSSLGVRASVMCIPKPPRLWQFKVVGSGTSRLSDFRKVRMRG